MTGVRGRSGKRADPDAARRLRSDDPQRFLKWIDLPPEGNLNPVPEMPPPPTLLLESAAWSVRAMDFWNKLWHSPQSTKWQSDLFPTLERYLLLYERLFTAGECTGPTINAMQTIEDSLGLTPKAMSNLYWRIHEPEEEIKLASVEAIESSTDGRTRRRLENYE